MLRRWFSGKSIVRSAKYSRLEDKDLKHFEGLLTNSDIITNSNDLEKYNHDWTKKYIGQSRLVLRPRSSEQVSAILAYCNERRLAVVPQGGNTGLVGGGVPVFDEIVLSTELMNRINDFDPVSGVLTVEAGCVLEVADTFVRERGHIMPLDLGAKGSCHIGGNIATNAGGLRLLRYGSLHGSVLGLEAVLADGKIINSLNVNRKDNTGYDLKQLFIGSEGTLGVITKANIITPALPTAVNVAVLAVDSYEKISSIFAQARRDLGEILSAFEFWDAGSQKLLDQHFASNPNVLGMQPFYVLIETSGSDANHDGEKLMRLLETLQQQSLVIDGTMAQDETQIKSLWALREAIPEACSKEGVVLKYDLTLPPAKMYDLVEAVRNRLNQAPSVKSIIGYGHFGDGNIHLNVATPSLDDKVIDLMEPFVYEQVQEMRGSISAEHGIGLMKSHYLSYSRRPEEIALMKQIKQMLDPNDILNPYKVLPA